MSKIEIAKLVNMASLAQLNSTVHKITDGVQGVGAISPEALKVIGKKVYSYMPPKASFMDTGIDIDNTGGVANIIESLRTVAQGDFEKTGVGSDTHGEITITGGSSSINVYGYMASSSYDDIGVMQAKQENRNIINELYQAHATKYFEKVDDLFYSALIGTAYDSTTATKTLEEMTNEELSEYFHTQFTNQRAGINSGYWANTLICSDKIYTHLHTRDYKAFGSRTVADKLMMDFGVKRIVATHHFNGSGAGGGDQYLLVNDMSVVNRIPMALQISPTHKRGWQNTFFGRFRVAGADVLEISGGAKGLIPN